MLTIDMIEYPEDNYIHPTAIVYPHVILGKNIYIGAYSVIGGPPEHRDFWNKEYKSVIIGDNVRISNHVTVDSGTERNTYISDNCILLAKCHIGHDAIIQDNVTISCGAKIGGHCHIGENSNIGLNACVHQRKQVPHHCMIGMNAAVTKKLHMSPYRKYAGVPAIDIGANFV